MRLIAAIPVALSIPICKTVNYNASWRLNNERKYIQET